MDLVGLVQRSISIFRWQSRTMPRMALLGEAFAGRGGADIGM